MCDTARAQTYNDLPSTVGIVRWSSLYLIPSSFKIEIPRKNDREKDVKLGRDDAIKFHQQIVLVVTISHSFVSLNMTGMFFTSLFSCFYLLKPCSYLFLRFAQLIWIDN